MFALLAPLASLLGLETEALIGRFRRQASLWTAIGIFLALAAVFLLVAAHSALALAFGPVIAPLILAGVALALALAIYLGALLLGSVTHHRQAERRRAAETRTLVTSAAIAAAPMLMKSPALKRLIFPAGTALAAAYVLARSGHHHDHTAEP